MSRAFPARSDCPVPSVSAIAGLLVSSCKVDPPPAPIFQFPIFAQPLPNPPSFNFGCYAPSLAVTVATNQTIPYFHGSIGYPSGATTGKCEPKFLFNIGFPASNCPDISASASVTVLAPDASPSAKLKVTKSDCNFQFKLDLGIPGNGACIDVETVGPLFDGGPAPPAHTPLEPGDQFQVIDDAFLDMFTSAGCEVIDLVMTGHTYTIGPANVGAVGHDGGAMSDCCTAFNVVTSIFSSTPGQIDFTYKQVKIPALGIDLGDALPTMSIGCTPVNVVGALFLSSTEGCPCADTLIVQQVPLVLDMPNFAAPAVTHGSDPGCCESIFYIAAAGGGNAGPSIVKSDCTYQLVYEYASFIIPQTVVGGVVSGATINLASANATVLGSVGTFSLTGCGCGTSIVPSSVTLTITGDTVSVTYVCSISCVTSSLVYTTGTLTFTNGILTGHGACS